MAVRPWKPQQILSTYTNQSSSRFSATPPHSPNPFSTNSLDNLTSKIPWIIYPYNLEISCALDAAAKSRHHQMPSHTGTPHPCKNIPVLVAGARRHPFSQLKLVYRNIIPCASLKFPITTPKCVPGAFMWIARGSCCGQLDKML